MTTEINYDNLYLTQPNPAANYHIFDKTNKHKSLCGKYQMIFLDKNNIEKVNGTEVYSKGQDCKTCFKKAGLLDNQEVTIEFDKLIF